MANKNGDDEAGKLFVGGINRSTSDDGFRAYFEKFGPIKDCILMKDRETGDSRGFGFVTYSDATALNEVLKNRPHTLDNKVIDAKPCTPRHMQPAKKFGSQYPKSNKIFLGGISMEASQEDVKSYFSRYGVVVEVVFVSDKTDMSRPHKGFGFITFEDESSVDQALAKHYHVIKDKRCEAKSAESKDKNNQNQNYNQQNQMGYGGQQANMGMANYGQQGNWMGANMLQGYGYGNQNFSTAYPQQYANQATYGTQQAATYANQSYGFGGYGGAVYGQQQQAAAPIQGGYQQQASGYGPARQDNTAQSYGVAGAGGMQNQAVANGGNYNQAKNQGYHPYKR